MSSDLMTPHHELAHDTLMKVGDYVSRRRHLAGMDVEGLEAELQCAARRVSVEGDNPCNSLAIYDALAEFDLRGIARPFHLIAQDIEIMAHRNAARIAAMTYEERRKIDDRIDQRYQAGCWQKQ